MRGQCGHTFYGILPKPVETLALEPLTERGKFARGRGLEWGKLEEWRGEAEAQRQAERWWQ